jgi:cardiolipin synthase A/B
MPSWRNHPPFRLLIKVLVVAAAVVAIGLFIAQDQDVLRIDSQLGADDPGFVDYAAALTGSPTTRGDRAEMLLNGDQIFPAMLDAIRQARRRINFESYIFGTGGVADQFARALADAARRGVQVHITVDSIGSSDMTREHVELLEGAGAEVASFNPPSPWGFEEVNYRSHRKILIVDGSVAFTGGVGVADHWAGRAQDKDHWRDSQFRIFGPVVRNMEAAFYENWIETRPHVTPVLDPAPPPCADDTASIVVWSSPTGGSSDIKRLYLLSLAGARRRVLITSPYFVTDESIRWTIEQARRRGVQIRVLVEGDVTDAKPVKYASRHEYEALLAQGVEIYEYQPTMMHAKTMVVDGTWCMFGTANFDNRSLELNDEINVAMRDRDLAETLARTFEDDVRSAKRLTLEDWKRRGLLEKAREQFWRWFAEIF